MRIAVFDRGHWHTQMHRAAFAATGHPVTVVDATHGAPLEAVLAERPDLTVLLGRPADMERDLWTCLEAGLAVAVEKPVSQTAQDLEPLMHRTRQTDSFVSVAQPHLLNTFWQVSTEAAGGPLSHFRFRLVNGPPQRYKQMGVPWVLNPEQAGGGVLRNLGIHGVSAFLQATTGDVHIHSCVLSRHLYHLDGEEYASAVLSADGVIGHVEVGYTAALNNASEFELSAHRRTLTVRDDGHRLHVLDRQAGHATVRDVLPLGRRYEQFAAATITALQTAQPAPHGLADHWRAMQVIDRCYAQATWVSA